MKNLFILLSISVFFTCAGQLLPEQVNEKKKTKVSLLGFEVDLIKKEVRLKATVCLTQGILEYLGCLSNSFEHEAIFITRGSPEVLHTGLLLAGYHPLPLYQFGELWWKAVDRTPACKMSIQVTWSEAGKKKSVPLNKLLLRRGRMEAKQEKLVYAKDFWVFNGSYFNQKNIYMAKVDKAVIAIMPQSSSVIQYGERTEDPHDGDHCGFEVNTELCPADGTDVELVITPYKKKSVSKIALTKE